MKRALKCGVKCPEVIHNDLKGHLLKMSYVENSLTLKAYLDLLIRLALAPQIKGILTATGELLQKLHRHDLIHGDLTTSNLLVQFPPELDPSDLSLLEDALRTGTPDTTVFLIDFGLSYQKPHAPEHKAVDLYVLERAFLSTHPSLEKEFPDLLEAYGGPKEVMTRLDEVRARGRKKLAFG